MTQGRLVDGGDSQPMCGEAAVVRFAEELRGVQDDSIRHFAIRVLWQADPLLLTGSLVQHTRAVVYMARELAQAYALDEWDTDLVIVGALLHDIGKPLAVVAGKANFAGHDLLGAASVESVGRKYDFRHWEAVREIVVSHNGIWGTERHDMADMSLLARIVHLADLVVTRRRVLESDFLDSFGD